MCFDNDGLCAFFHSIWKNLHLTEIFYTEMSVVSVTNMRYVGKHYHYHVIIIMRSVTNPMFQDLPTAKRGADKPTALSLSLPWVYQIRPQPLSHGKSCIYPVSN